MQQLSNRQRRAAGGYVKLAAVCALCMVSVTPFAACGNTTSQSVQKMPTPIRAVHFVSLGVSPGKMRLLIDQAAAEEFNVVVIGFGWRDSMRIDAMPWARKDAPWTRQTIRQLADYARRHSIAVVPHLPLLSKQHIFLGPHFPELLYNEKTYDPRKPHVYEVVLPIIDELIELIDPPAFHIGHDELQGSPNRAAHWKPGQDLLPAELFLADVSKLHAHLQSRGVSTWMWSDMLLGESEFRRMHRASLLGDVPGYGEELRRKLSKEILVVDWHYRDVGENFDSTNTLVSEGFKVIGATWKFDRNIRDFSRYAAANGAIGMLATTWFHTRNEKDAEVVADILRISGEAFRANFGADEEQE